MRSRAIIHVVGQGGAGKTSFIERFLGFTHLMATCVRAEQDEKLRKVQVSSSRGHPDLRRYLKAGADTVAFYRFNHPDDMAFYGADFMQEYSNVVWIEGDCPVRFVDLAVYITEPPREGRLLRRSTGEPVEAEQQSTQQDEDLLQDQDAILAMLEDGLGKDVVAMALKKPGVLDEVVQAMRSSLEEQRAVRVPRSAPVWTLAPGYAGLVEAKLVVINLPGEADRTKAERMLEDITRLRKDPEVFDDIIGHRGRKTPITAVAADLSHPKDPGLRKALARVMRTIKNS